MQLPRLLYFFFFFFAAGHGVSSVSPLLAPNFSSCHSPYNLPLGESSLNCCPPPASYSPPLFRPTSSSSPAPLRVRRPSHSVDESYAQKLAHAYTLMKSLPSDDPRSFTQQANIHCAYCNTAYDQMNSSQVFQVHGSWLFFPFHRWYLYFHERILAKLLDDDSFALSFWNYDHPDGASIPWLYSSYNANLSCSLRDSFHESPAAVAIDFTVDSDTRPREIQLRENDNAMYRALIRDASTHHGFFGWPYRHGDSPISGYGDGTVEDRPHNSVHLWVGSKAEIGWKNMGSLYAAARDPIFYAHHAQLDRLWEVWRSFPNHDDIQDEDYLNAEFVFYNEDAQLVRVKVGDAINTETLGYVYEDVETPWMDAVPVQLSTGPAVLNADDSVCTEGEQIRTPCSIVIQRDPKVTRESPWLHDRLVVNVQYNPKKKVHVDFFVNLPSANASMDTGCSEFLYHLQSYPSFVSVDVDVINMTFKIDLSERLVELKLVEESSIVVTFVPRFPPTDATYYVTLLEHSVEYALPTERWDSDSASMISHTANSYWLLAQTQEDGIRKE